MQNKKWLDVSEYLLLAGSGIGSVASIASQQLAFAAAPLSFLFLLNLLNRRRLDQAVSETAQTQLAQVEQKLSEQLSTLDQQVRTLPTFIDLSSQRKTILQRNDTAIAQLQQHLSQRIAVLESKNVDRLERELAQLQTKYSQLAESIGTVTNCLSRVATQDRVEASEAAIGTLKTELAQLHTKVAEITSAQKQGIPRVLQDELNQIHRRLSHLPQPFDPTSLKQDVEGLVKVMGEMVSRRDLAKLMAEVEKIRHSHHNLEQTVAPMKSINTIMRKQMETLSSWLIVKDAHSDHAVQFATQSHTVELEELKATIAGLEHRLNTLPNSADLLKLNEELTNHLGKLQAQFKSVQEVAQGLDRQQQTVSEWLTRLPETLDASAIRSQMKYLTARLTAAETNLAVLKSQAPSARAHSEYELIFNCQSGTADAPNRALLQTALATAQSRIILVFPYPDRAMFDADLLPQFQAFLDRGGVLEIGWGHLGEISDAQQARYILDRHTAATEKKFLSSVLSQLTQLKRNYPNQFRFKVLGTNENFLVCDRTYTVLGIQPVATRSAAFPELALGLKTSNPDIIQGLIERFEQPDLAADDETGYYNRAVTRYELGDKQGAIADLSEVVRINPNHAIAYNNRALIRQELGNKESAIADLNRAILSNPRLCIPYCNRGVLRLMMGDKTGAIDDFSYAIQVNPDCVNAHYQRGLARMKQGHKQGAIDDFSAMIRIAPQDPVGHFNRGLVRSKLGDKTNAIRDFKEAAWLFSSQGDQAKYQHALDAIQQLRQRHGAIAVPSPVALQES
jgi:tetratricopeptide (TPR) repeat protein